jgi:hypothetical protein
MANIIAMPKRKRPARAPAPGQRRRAYTPEMVEEVEYFLNLFEASVTLREGGEMGYLDDKAWKYAGSIREDMLRRITNSIDLAGLEYRDGLGQLIATIQAVTEPGKGQISPSNTWIHHTGGAITMREFLKNLNKYFYYVCLPDCDNYGDRAMAEAFWAKLAEWGVFPETRKMRVPPAGIFAAPEP